LAGQFVEFTPLPQQTPPFDPPVADSRPRRTIRSFVPRGGRMTRAQERAWVELWPRLGIEDVEAPLDLDALFGRCARRSVEIGFGNGEALLALAAANPEEDFLGVEVHRPGVGHLMLRCEELAVGNLRIVCRDAVDVLEQLPAASLDEVLLYFPDPWPKKRHHKRRIVQDAFVSLVADRLRPGGLFRLATDWQPYADWMLETLARCPAFRNESSDGSWVERPGSRPPTRFELRGQRLGHGVWDLCFRRV
jgi:tRNA (guanine-N7-)-methyltransferase